MSVFPIPKELNPSHYSWDTEIREAMKVQFSRDPKLKALFNTVAQPNWNKRFAAALRNNTEIKYLIFETGYTSQGMLDDISTMTSLERLAFGYLRATDISGLANLKRLQYLCIESLSSTSNLQPVIALRELISLFIGISPKINSLEDFSQNSLYRLRALFLGESSERVITVDSLNPLGAVSSLEYLVLGRIRSRDRSLSRLVDLPHLKVFQYDKNARFNSDHIDALKSRGIAVTTF